MKSNNERSDSFKHGFISNNIKTSNYALNEHLRIAMEQKKNEKKMISIQQEGLGMHS